MAMMWRPTGRSRERILAYGPGGAGKSYGAMTVLAKALGPDDTAYVIDIDNSWDRLLEEDGGPADALTVREEYRGKARDREYEVEGGNVVMFHAQGWEEATWALARAFKEAGRDDWIVVDSMSWLWDDIAEWYIKKVHGDDMPDFLLAHRMDQVKAGANPTQGQDAVLIEWSFINAQWNKHVATPIVNAHCHVYMCAEAKDLRTDGRVDKAVASLYGQIGQVPKTQKRAGHQAQTVLYLSQKRTGDRLVTTAKDRSREWLAEEEWTDLFATYIRPVAGWKPKKIDNKETTDE